MDRTGECWTWTGYCLPNGYGYLRINKIAQYAHRVAWALAHGRDPRPTEVVRHTCDVRSCCRPDHLQIGTARDNNLDTVRRHRSGATKLTEEDVRQMRRLADAGVDLKDIAKQYGCSHANVGFVVRRISWAWLDHPDNEAFAPMAEASRRGTTPRFEPTDRRSPSRAQLEGLD